MSLRSEISNEQIQRIRAYIARRVRTPELVDDLAQEVFLKAFENLHTVQARGSIAPWLYRIAANVIADHFRSQTPSVELPENLATPEHITNPVAELAMCLKPLIDDLPDTYREALTLSEIDGVSQKELALRLNISYSGAKSRVQRGREKLRQRLHECCVIETGRRGIVSYDPRDSRACDECS